MKPDFKQAMAVSFCDEMHRTCLLRVCGKFEHHLGLEVATFLDAFVLLLDPWLVDGFKLIDVLLFNLRHLLNVP